MSIERRHAYRFGFLKSEKWQQLRLEALVRTKAICQLCGFKSIENDVHHVWYASNWRDTHLNDLVVLCRRCHDLVHKRLDELPKIRKRGQSFRQFRKLFPVLQEELQSTIAEEKLARKKLRELKVEEKRQKKLFRVKKSCVACRQFDAREVVNVFERIFGRTGMMEIKLCELCRYDLIMMRMARPEMKISDVRRWLVYRFHLTLAPRQYKVIPSVKPLPA